MSWKSLGLMPKLFSPSTSRDSDSRISTILCVCVSVCVCVMCVWVCESVCVCVKILSKEILKAVYSLKYVCAFFLQNNPI